MKRRKIISESVEYNVVEHCNLACYNCDHASPLLAERFASLDSFERDAGALAGVLHARQLRIVGGEPLLHPRLLDFLRAARGRGIADELVVLTNGTLLHKMPPEFYALIDRLWVSVYPGVKHAIDWSECSRLCMDHDVILDIRHRPEFMHTLTNVKIEDAETIGAVFQDCGMVGERGCPAIYDGRFYPCCVAPFTPARLALRGVPFDNRGSDGVSLHGNPALFEQIEASLKRRVPLSACSYCLGTSAPKSRHRQLNRQGRAAWLAEDDSAQIAATRERLLGRV